MVNTITARLQERKNNGDVFYELLNIILIERLQLPTFASAIFLWQDKTKDWLGRGCVHLYLHECKLLMINTT